MNFITLITDFGLTGWYTGELKGSIVSWYQDAHLIDITHTVPPHDIRSAALTLAASFYSFPERTVFCVVVDPGVRTSRRALAIHVDNRFLVGPDNGVLSWVPHNQYIPQVRHIETSAVVGDHLASNSALSSDVFGPAAAYLASGRDFSAIGPIVTDSITLPYPQTKVTSDELVSEVLTIDQFGNIITAADNKYLANRSHDIIVSLGTMTTSAFVATAYSQVPEGAILVYCGSGNRIEIGINRGNAADFFSAHCGSLVRLLFR